MRTAYTEALITSVPTDELLILAVVFSLAALVLFALSVEAGNYPGIRARIRGYRSALRHLRSHRWHGEGLST